MKTLNYLTFLLFLAMGVGCYEDKGNYDYNDIDLVSITFTPNDFVLTSTNSAKFVYKQPLMDTLKGEISVEGVRFKNGDNKDSDDLEYSWVKVAGGKKDTTYGRTLRYAFPPKKTSSFTYNLIVKDPKTTLELYREVIVSTQVPYLNSWFLLHGEAGDMKLGTIEMGEEKTFITQDAYFDVNGERQFQNATDMTYSLTNGPFGVEGLSIIAPDEAFSISPFKMQILNKYEYIVPLETPRIVLRKLVTDSKSYCTCIITEDKKILHSGSQFLHFKVNIDPSDPRTAKYNADDCFIGENGAYTIWDAKQRCFHYYNAAMNQYRAGTDRTDEAKINLAKMITIPDNVWEKDELATRSVVRFSSADANDLMAIMKDDNDGRLWAYNISYAGDDKTLKGDEPGTGISFKVGRYELTGVTIDKESPFATSTAFTDQFFYSVGNKLYRYNYMNGDRQEIYSTEDESDQITLMRFASPLYFALFNPADYTKKDYYYRLLGISVCKSDNTYELHNVLLSKSGDKESSSVYGSFGKIKQILFSLQTRVY